MNKEKRIHIGQVAVDSGTLMITDPCYVVGDDWNEKAYTRYVVEAKPLIGYTYSTKTEKFKGHHVLFSSGLGDGIYDVYAYRRKLGKFGERTTKVEIVMITDEEAAEYESN